MHVVIIERHVAKKIKGGFEQILEKLLESFMTAVFRNFD